MELRRRKYSEVSKQFILSIVDDKIGALKTFLKKAPIWAAIGLAVMAGKSYWDNGYIPYETLENGFWGLICFGVIMIIVFVK